MAFINGLGSDVVKSLKRISKERDFHFNVAEATFRASLLTGFDVCCSPRWDVGMLWESHIHGSHSNE